MKSSSGLNGLEQNVNIELTILMPCLNEAETLAICIRKAKAFLVQTGIAGEVLIADNGSTDGSRAIAEAEGARVIPVATKGYGAALRGGISSASGTFVIMGDADDSYDFSSLMPFVERLRSGADIVMGNRFQGGIAPGAMPFLHRYLGNPVLSWIGRLFFKIKVGDFHCGLRGFNREKIRDLELRTTGMEFASEMLVRASLEGYEIAEVPTTLKKDGRSRPPHLRTWRDGWRHLTFLLMYSPKWLFIYPGLFLLVFGLVAAFALLPGTLRIDDVSFDVHTFIVACFSVLIGIQALSFAALAHRFADKNKLIPISGRHSRLLDWLTLERVLIGGGILFVLGAGGTGWCVAQWASVSFGPLVYASLLRVLLLSVTSMAIGLQLAFTAFLSAIIEIPTR
ncbi:glycosyltransferase family 2 protein [Kaistia dalseonensis]|uniref:Glycosyltransferase involved in cell wall biosynthesis n=1 Tax=Kaistia dalseonensis TaxID=410840 RepID=A0ABU0H4M1_9HYPH|nr:glycosyltransferase family 2 protein [Kaistia dalseonensis]MCX5494233.1 glycosyltransferase family 2 protein [Kaistia dalseonensis]MDQ0436813.1 glycosyltransferase involved in cell wall biosynthesis [Kaistia dalseonensis]